MAFDLFISQFASSIELENAGGTGTDSQSVANTRGFLASQNGHSAQIHPVQLQVRATLS